MANTPKKQITLSVTEADISDKEIYLMFAFPGDRHEDSTPYAFITLSNFKQFAKQQFHEEQECEFYMTIMIPDKPIACEGDDTLSFVRVFEKNIVQTSQNAFDIDDEEDYQQFVRYIKRLYIPKLYHV